MAATNLGAMRRQKGDRKWRQGEEEEKKNSGWEKKERRRGRRKGN